MSRETREVKVDGCPAADCCSSGSRTQHEGGFEFFRQASDTTSIPHGTSMASLSGDLRRNRQSRRGRR